MIHGHGSDRYLCDAEIIADFSSNIWYDGLHPALSNHIESKIKDIIHYPEPDAGALTCNIAKKHSVDKSNILVTNGATEAFYLLAQIMSCRTSYILYPAFAEYEDACTIFNHSIIFLKNSELIEDMRFISHSTLWLGNPNNPDYYVYNQTKELYHLFPDSTTLIYNRNFLSIKSSQF